MAAPLGALFGTLSDLPLHQLVTYLVSALALPAVIWLVRDYRAWVAYGTGGFNPTPLGYTLVSLIRLKRYLTSDSGRDPAVLRRIAQKSNRKRWSESFLTDEVPKRKGERPAMRACPLPHRQLHPALSLTKARGDVTAYFDHLASANSNLLVTQTSLLERHGPALAIHPDLSGLPEGDTFTRGWGKGEVAHVHEEEGSLHVTLSLEDAAKCVESGWGERMPAAGVARMVPLGNVLIYAPRNDAELDVVKSFVLAGCRFFLGQEISA